MRRAWLCLGLALAACPGGKTPLRPSVEPTVASDSDLERRRRLIAELQDEILTSYERDELPEVETLLIDPQVGPARIGVGPGDVYYGEDVAHLASSRWPLQVESGTPTTVRSKRLQIALSSDRQVSAAWMSDELSWRITLCGRTAVVPLRITALYAHDGDRWVQLFEHLSFGRIPQPTPTGELRGKEIPEAVVEPKLADTIARQLNALISGDTSRMSLVVAATGNIEDPTRPPPTILVGPGPDGEWGGGDPAAIRLVDGKLTLDRPRIGTIGHPDKAQIAYWVGNLVAELRHHPGTEHSKILLRGSFVFEKRQDKWIIVQGHVSQSIDDIDLASFIYGTALISDKPLQITCDDGRRSVPVATP
jgi:hypothetical protein